MKRGSELVFEIMRTDVNCSRVRLDLPCKYLAREKGVRVHETTMAEAYEGALRPDFQNRIILIQRQVFAAASHSVEVFSRMARNRNLVLFEIDDDPIFWKAQFERTGYMEFRACHAVQTSTEPLARSLAALNPHVLLFENEVERVMAEAQLEEKLGRNDGIATVFFGAINRRADWEEILPALNAAIRRHGEALFFKVVADEAFFDALETKAKQLVGGSPACDDQAPFEAYARAMAESDIAVLPLRDTEFNRMKSDLKFLECAARGTVVLASPVVYAQTVRDGRTGFLYHSEAEFAAYLDALVTDRELRAETAYLAWRYVKKNRLMKDHAKARLAKYRELLADWDRLEEARQARSRA